MTPFKESPVTVLKSFAFKVPSLTRAHAYSARLPSSQVGAMTHSTRSQARHKYNIAISFTVGDAFWLGSFSFWLCFAIFHWPIEFTVRTHWLKKRRGGRGMAE